MAYIGRRFSLSEVQGIGVSCSEKGVFVGAVPLLERVWNSDDIGQDQWRLRPASGLNRDLSACYGLPVEFDQKIDGLVAVAQALNRSDVIHAQIGTLHLEIPDPPPLIKSAQTADNILEAAECLKPIGIQRSIRAGRVEGPGGIGGEFAPNGATSDATTAAEQGTNGDAGAGALITPAQLTIPAPFDFPIPPLPSEILPPPAIPDIYPRELTNPYPDRAGCDEEWADAIAYCKSLLERNQLGRGDYRGSGRSLYQCIMGQVSERCGGNSTGA